MTHLLKKELARIEKELNDLKVDYQMEPTQDQSSVVLANPETRKAIIVGEVENDGYRMVVAYGIDVNKWYWAEQEGFSRDEIVSDLATDVFTNLSLKDVVKNLI